jgi:hypothetical protein
MRPWRPRGVSLLQPMSVALVSRRYGICVIYRNFVLASGLMAVKAWLFKYRSCSAEVVAFRRGIQRVLSMEDTYTSTGLCT